MKFNFGNVVVVEDGLVGVIVKTWQKLDKNGILVYTYEIYVRSFNAIKEYPGAEIQHYIYHKELDEKDLIYY